MNASIAALRQEYSSQVLSETDVADDPIEQFGRWWQQALETAIIEPNAMTLATASSDGMPSARVVLLKDFDRNGFVFFYELPELQGPSAGRKPKGLPGVFLERTRKASAHNRAR